MSLVAAGALGPLADRGDFAPDTAIGIVFSSALGVSFLLLSIIPGPKTEALSLLWGSVLTVTAGSLYLLAAVAIGAMLIIGLFFKEIQTVIFNQRTCQIAGAARDVCLLRDFDLERTYNHRITERDRRAACVQPDSQSGSGGISAYIQLEEDVRNRGRFRSCVRLDWSGAFLATELADRGSYNTCHPARSLFWRMHSRLRDALVNRL